MELEEELAVAKVQYKASNADVDMPTDTEEGQRKIIKARIKERIMTHAALKQSDKKKYGNLQIKLHNDYLIGKDDYPRSEASMLNLLNNWKQEWVDNRPPGQQHRRSPSPHPRAYRNAVSFLQAGDGPTINFLKGTNGSFYPRITC